jgi:uncharacterized protein YcbX
MMIYSLTQINIYPVKSLGGIELGQAEVTDRGLKYDRRWMIVDPAGRFLTQRTHPELALIMVNLNPPVMELKHRLTGEAIEFDIAYRDGNQQTVVIWNDTVRARHVDNKIDVWLRDNLKIDCSLIYMPDETRREVNKDFSSNNEIVGFADAFPFLIIGEESLNDLNSRLKEKVPMNRFRPNFVFSGGEPYDEDRWKSFELSGVTFYPVKPCSRCVIPNVDQKTGRRSDEPLKTLTLYRSLNNNVYFGQNLLHSGQGIINTGDELRDIEMK